MSQDKKETERKEPIAPAQFRQIQELASTIRYGSITLVFQDGALIQIEKNEKIRISKP
ncbi:MAG: YezD family protein [Oscillospiraceae bacterium]|nr:YezD family protein [Oscillospiraceae bacterium]MCD7749065.1 YezD family protein [Oscillospiraceae bacterium]MCD8117195.1 YezD family protein [Oscillospiraceae bacterium]